MTIYYQPIVLALGLALIATSCGSKYARTKDNYIAHGVPVTCYYIPKPGESEESEKWWASGLSDEDFHWCYEKQQRVDLEIREKRSQALEELGDAMMREAERMRRSRRCDTYGVCN